MPRLKSLTLSSLSTLALLAAAPAGATTFTISWWGFNGDKLQDIIVNPFQEMCGCEVVFETGNNGDRVNRLQMRSGAGVDVIYLTDSYSQAAIEQGLFQPIDRAQIPNIDQLYDLAQAPQGEFGPAYTVGRIGLVYDAARVSPPITSWNDLWREDLAGMISLPNITTTSGPMVVLRAGAHAGVNAFEDADAAFGALAELVPNVVTNYNTGSEMINLFSTGEIAVSMTQDFTLNPLRAAVPTIEWAQLEDGEIAVLNTLNIPVGSENVELAHQFINFVLSAEIQQQLAEQGVDAPVNTMVDLTPEQASAWTYGADQIASLHRIDYSQLNPARTQWLDRWNETFGM
ncbi:ABC transporter substrate-binding protein [Pararhodobacter zhoushanensis]|uniref:ABC transporter substrate-binding protein n=1 Tax=Pararhodobacter zhoushanensis TaxID=2479545 RepID=A0ABT3GVY8_9RHOB|nr:ABC transporter substrate-binding protein [Pararhodobacter zhoushanensis]MCW1931712.1 ABC transporter substrate-binding protein [Pararhodobacter zhoushanensis]